LNQNIEDILSLTAAIITISSFSYGVAKHFLESEAKTTNTTKRISETPPQNRARSRPPETRPPKHFKNVSEMYWGIAFSPLMSCAGNLLLYLIVSFASLPVILIINIVAGTNIDLFFLLDLDEGTIFLATILGGIAGYILIIRAYSQQFTKDKYTLAMRLHFVSAVTATSTFFIYGAGKFTGFGFVPQATGITLLACLMFSALFLARSK